MQDLLLLYSLMTENSPFITHPPSLYFSGFCDKTEPPEFPEQNESRKSPVLHRRPERPGFPIPENILFLSGSELLLFPAPSAGRKNKKLQTQSCSQPGAKITVPFLLPFSLAAAQRALFRQSRSLFRHRYVFLSFFLIQGSPFRLSKFPSVPVPPLRLQKE